MVFMFSNLEFVAIGSNFIEIRENYTLFPQGSKPSSLYLIERFDKSHGRSFGYAYESLKMYSTHPIFKFKNSSRFLHIWEAISSTYCEGGFEPKIASKILYLVQNLV